MSDDAFFPPSGMHTTMAQPCRCPSGPGRSFGSSFDFMHTKFVSFCAALLALGLIPTLSAQSTGGTPKDSSGAGVVMQAAVQLRSTLAKSVGSGEKSPKEAIAQLHTNVASSGVPVEADADFALAAIDIGQRLIAANKAAAAEPFFQAAEAALAPLAARTANSDAKTRAMLLRKLSLIRGRYLNKVTEAKADIEQAIALQPEDKRLQQARDELAVRDITKFQKKG
jgi:hypothetical protein